VNHPTVTSREYKVMLRQSRFAGDRTRQRTAADGFWREFRDRVAGLALGTTGGFDTEKDRRFIRFYDTARQTLHGSRYILRRRWDASRGAQDGSQKAELTLKFRHPDRYIAQDHVAEDGALQTKFEEDIKGPFASLYSVSMTPRAPNGDVPLSLRSLADLFPGVKDVVPDTNAGEHLEAVGGLTALEVVLGGAAIQIGTNTAADCALIFWYETSSDQHADPIAVEFSYRHRDKDGDYRGARIQRAFDMFEALQTKLPDWIDPEVTTKTALVYKRAALFA